MVIDQLDEKGVMPKIVDHAAHQVELAGRAVAYFSEQGYAGASMRKIAEYLGVSKSALYHYFPSKEELFLASTKVMMGKVAGLLEVEGRTEEIKIQQLIDILRVDFSSELSLTVEYLRGKGPKEIADDEAMQIARSTYRQAVEAIVGPERADETLANIMGTLLLNYLSGKTADVDPADD